MIVTVIILGGMMASAIMARRAIRRHKVTWMTRSILAAQISQRHVPWWNMSRHRLWDKETTR